MVQGGKTNKKNNIKKNSKRKEKIEAHKRKHAPIEVKEQFDENQVSKMFHKKVKEHQKKIYKSIEQTIIEKARHQRERFELI
jgi:hypothetical protein